MAVKTLEERVAILERKLNEIEKQKEKADEQADVMAGLTDIAQGRVYPLDEVCEEIIARIKQAQK